MVTPQPTDRQTAHPTEQTEPTPRQQSMKDSTMIVGFPSADFPGPPPFQFELPDDWRAVPSVETDATVIAPDEVDGVRPNVVLNSHKVLADEAPGRLLESLLDRWIAAPDTVAGSIVDQDTPPLDTIDRRSRAVSFRRRVDNGAGAMVEVVQSVHLHYVGGPHIAYVLVATGTHAPTDDDGAKTVDAIISSVRC